MPVETAADRLTFLSADEFGCEVTYTPVGGGLPLTVVGVFDSDFIAVDVGGEVPAATRQPRLHCRVDDLTLGGKEGDVIAITALQLAAAGLDTNSAGSYRVSVVQPDGTGMVTVALEKTS